MTARVENKLSRVEVVRKPDSQVVARLPAAKEVVRRVAVDRVHNCVLCNDKDGRSMNLGSGLWDIKYHYAVCYYNAGAMFDIVDPGAENKAEQGVVDEVLRFRYTCPIKKKCSMNEGSKPKQMGYKQYAIHAGHEHNMVELAMQRDAGHAKEMAPVLEALAAARLAEELDEPSLPPVLVEETHACLLCGGRDNKEALTLSLEGDRILSARYHYAQCYYGLAVYWSPGPNGEPILYNPGEKNTDSEGKPVDELGANVKYRCEEVLPNKKRCEATKKRSMGYKEFCIHSANVHGGLVEALLRDEREELRSLAPKFKAIRARLC